MLKPSISRVVALAAGAVLFTACGGPADETGGATPESTAETTPEAGSTEATESPGGEASSQPIDTGDGVLVINSFGGDYQEAHEEIVIRPFEEEYGVEVEVITAYSADALAQLKAQADNPQFDVVHFSGGQEVPALEDGLLAPLTVEDLPQAESLAPLATEGLTSNGTGPVYQVTPIGLIYSTEQFDEPPTSWQAVLSDEMAGHVVLTDLTNTYGILGMLAVNETLGGQFPDVEEGVSTLGELVSSGDAILVETSPEIQQAFAQRGAWLAPYAQDYATTLIRADVPVDFVIPDEGGPASLITANVVANGGNEELAKAFVDYQLRPDVQAAWADALSYSPTNLEVELSGETAELVVAPDEFDSLEIFDPLVIDENREAWTQQWNELIAQ